METHAQGPTMWQRSTIHRFFAWLFTWRIMRRVVFGLAILATLIAIAVTISNSRAKRAWTQYKQELEAKGEKLDWAAFVPPAVPDEKNFAATPFLKLVIKNGNESPEYRKRWPKDFDNASNEVNPIRQKRRGTSGPLIGRQPIDLVAWQAAFKKVQTGNAGTVPPLSKEDAAMRTTAAMAVLEHLKVYEPVLEELRQASSRPAARFDVNYYAENPALMLLPHLAPTKKICSLLQLHAGAELALGQNDLAYQDVQLMFRLSDTMRDEPLLISCLVGIAMTRVTTEVIWEGLARHQWSDAQLQALQARLQQDDWMAAMNQTMRAERASIVRLFEFLRNQPNRGRVLQETMSGDQDQGAPWEHFFLPSSWLYWEQYNYVRLFQDTFIMSMSAETKRIEPTRCKEAEKKLEISIYRGFRAALWDHTMLSGILLPALIRTQMKAAEAQTIVDEAVLGCALERYRRAKGQFPDSLEALVPAFMEKLPHDVITGAALIYRRTEDGQFLLYSVGWDEKDDGGYVALNSSKPGPQDWVWQYPAEKRQ